MPLNAQPFREGAIRQMGFHVDFTLLTRWGLPIWASKQSKQCNCNIVQYCRDLKQFAFSTRAEEKKSKYSGGPVRNPNWDGWELVGSFHQLCNDNSLNSLKSILRSLLLRRWALTHVFGALALRDFWTAPLAWRSPCSALPAPALSAVCLFLLGLRLYVSLVEHSTHLPLNLVLKQFLPSLSRRPYALTNSNGLLLVWKVTRLIRYLNLEVRL